MHLISEFRCPITLSICPPVPARRSLSSCRLDERPPASLHILLLTAPQIEEKSWPDFSPALRSAAGPPPRVPPQSTEPFPDTASAKLKPLLHPPALHASVGRHFPPTC